MVSALFSNSSTSPPEKREKLHSPSFHSLPENCFLTILFNFISPDNTFTSLRPSRTEGFDSFSLLSTLISLSFVTVRHYYKRESYLLDGWLFHKQASNRLESTEAQSINGSNQRMIKKRFREGTWKV